MKILPVLFFMTALFLVLQINPAWAAEGGGDAIWHILAGKAAQVGDGLKKTGFIIAGLGLIFFSFMAIFNKISWKNLAYIMLSCFVLTAMVGLVNYFSSSDDTADISDSFEGNGADTSITIKSGVGPAEGTTPTVN